MKDGRIESEMRQTNMLRGVVNQEITQLTTAFSMEQQWLQVSDTVIIFILDHAILSFYSLIFRLN